MNWVTDDRQAMGDAHVLEKQITNLGTDVLQCSSTRERNLLLRPGHKECRIYNKRRIQKLEMREKLTKTITEILFIWGKEINNKKTKNVH